MPDRLWAFNPGASTFPCCGGETAPTGCCPQVFCPSYSHDPVTLTDMYGSHVMTWYPTSSGWINGSWRCCYVIPDWPHARMLCGVPTPGPITIVYMFGCNASGVLVLAMSNRRYDCSGHDAYEPGSYCVGDDASVSMFPALGVGKIGEDATSIRYTLGAQIPDYPKPLFGEATVTRPGTVPVAGIPHVVYLSDGFGTVPLVYGGTGERPAVGAWAGCATRIARGGRMPNDPYGCGLTPQDIETSIYYTITCSGNVYALQVLHSRCSEPGGTGLYHLVPSSYGGCGYFWNSYTGTIPISALPSDCNPFHLEFSHDWRTGTTPYLSEIYGPLMDLVITA